MKARNFTLKDVCEAIVDCEHKTAPTRPTGHPSIRTPNIGRGRLVLDGVHRVSEETYKLWTQRMEPRPGDLILAREAPVGNVAIIPRGLRVCLGQRTVLIRADRRKVLPEYLVYLMLGDEIQGRVQSLSNGATVHHLNMKDIRDLLLPVLPEMDEQRRIASILSAYDDLIANNMRRIEILEELARCIYEEWFVDFSFPGHESVRMVESELGQIPEGWSVRQLDDVSTVTMGLSPKGDTYNEGGEGTPLVNGPVEFGEHFTKKVKWTTAPTKFCGPGDLIVCVRGSTTGKYVKSDDIYCLGRGVCAVRSDYQCFVDQLFIHQLPTLLAQTGGSTFPSWTGPQLKTHPVLAPPQDLMHQFETVAEPMSKAVLAYSRQNTNLRLTRDLLLPKLISGELDVSLLPEPEAAVA